jgi:agmatinase
MEGLLRNDTNIHAGIRTTLSGPSDYENDGYCGFEIVEAREIDTIGIYTYPIPPPHPSSQSYHIRK